MPYLTLHGHFYQPPRENPWTDEIDRELTAAPHHDWNERINAECYRPNAFARVLGDDGRVVDILNTYDYLSFNFGPTLLSWLRAQAPDVYARLRQGDAASRQRLGHGNALAQVYNHMILPLANRRDKFTQVAWGLADFRFHFGREAEAVWLAETAVDEETLEVLAAAGLHFVVLAASQAALVRPLDAVPAAAWTDVGAGQVDPSRAYLCRLASGRSIAVFFYDGALAHSLSFGDTLRDGRSFMAQLWRCVDPGRPHPQLIHAATDGETFGHHKKHAERTLIYAFTQMAPADGFTIVNYATFLELAPPAWEVKIKPNTAWSCAHGLGRWSQDCGCNTGRVPGGHQRWRAPLRAALDNLRDRLADLYEREAPALLGPAPWQARNAYGEILADRDPERVDAFLARHAGRPLSAEDRVRALTLLEMQRHAQLMYTSCGWFFDDLSGLETTQVLKYAAHAIDLAARFSPQDFTTPFQADLAKAEGNFTAHRTGADVYRQLVLPAAIHPERIAASYAIAALVDPFPIRLNRHAYRIEQTHHTAYEAGPYNVVCGHVRLTSDFTGRQTGWAYAALHLGGYNFAASVIFCQDPADGQKVCAVIGQQPTDGSMTALLRLLKAALGPTLYGLNELPPNDRRRLMTVLDAELLSGLARSYQQIYTQHLGTIAALRAANMLVPTELRLAAEYTLSHQLAQAAARLAQTPDEAAQADLAGVLELARQDNIALDRGEAVRVLETAIVEGVLAIVRAVNGSEPSREYQRLNRLIAATDQLGLEIRPARAQELLLEYLRRRGGHIPILALQLAENLRISPQAIAYRA
ncbi:MAG: DUF3536 domain-containing protein [Anaerolineales bacterium]|nr:DUF3536 domain-containing protein [Anaerolineales bacterium]